MKKNPKLEPKPLTVLIMVDGLLRNQDYGRAFELLEGIDRKQYPPSIHSRLVRASIGIRRMDLAHKYVHEAMVESPQ